MEVQLPGFRFHPTEQELLNDYLKKAINSKIHPDIIGFLNIYHYDPWQLPEKAKEGQGEREWYFFVAKDRIGKHSTNGKANRTTANGFWKATGSERQIWSCSHSGAKQVLGLKKTLVFYKGRAPRGSRTDWVMNEFRLPNNSSPPKEDVVLCKVYRKATSFKVLEQKSMVEERQGEFVPTPTLSSPTTSVDKLGRHGVPREDLRSMFLSPPVWIQDSPDYDKCQKITSLCSKNGSEEVDSPFQVQDNWSLFHF